MEGFDEIFWHDSEIESAVELPSENAVILNVQYPIDWEKNIFESRSIVFEDYFAYEVSEMPFDGNPTILSAEILSEVGSPFQQGGFFKVHIKTNAGNRFVIAKRIKLGGKYVGI